jgi:hypothetical protein
LLCGHAHAAEQDFQRFGWLYCGVRSESMQVYEQLSVRKARRDAMCRMHGKRRLAHARHSVDRQDRNRWLLRRDVTQEMGDSVKFVVPVGEVGYVPWKIPPRRLRALLRRARSRMVMRSTSGPRLPDLSHDNGDAQQECQQPSDPEIRPPAAGQVPGGNVGHRRENQNNDER